MHAILALPRGARHPAWYTPLLLPLLPLVPLLWRGGDTPLAVPLVGPVHLLAWGAVLAFLVPHLVDHLGLAGRKEAELLRPAWLTALLLAQLPLVVREVPDELGVAFFAAACALLGSIPFGIEIQQGTLPSLLSAPMSRERWWNLKLGLLGGALATFWLTFMLTWLASGRPCGPFLALELLLIAAIAWGTTPWWTLLMRGLITGLVSSMAIPIGFAIAVSLAWEVWDRFGPPSNATHLGEDILPWCLVALGPIYAAAGTWAGARRWRRLEAPDLRVEGFEVSLYRRRREIERAAPSRVRPPLHALFRKENRLQSITWALLVLALPLVAVAVVTADPQFLHSLALGGALLVTTSAVFLAGALPIAEERRLGTLDLELIHPLSLRARWWTKLAAGILPASVALSLAVASIVTAQDGVAAVIGQAALLGFAFFALALLASSVSQNALRALLLGVTAAGAVIGIAGMTWVWAFHYGETAAQDYLALVVQDPNPLRAEAARLGETGVANLVGIDASTIVSTSTTVGRIWMAIASIGLPCLLALGLARANFGRLTVRFGRALGQFAACLAVCGLVCGLLVLHAWYRGRIDAHRWMLAEASRTQRWETTLTPTEHALWEKFRCGPFDWRIDVSVSPPTDGHGYIEERALRPRVLLPLTRGDRDMLIRRGAISDDLKNGLREDAAKAPPPELPPPIRRRYGIGPRSVESPAGTPRADSAPLTRPGTAPASAAAPANPTSPLQPTRP